jgi:heat shock protein HslJ
MKKIFILIVIFCTVASLVFLAYQLWPTSNFYAEKQIPDLPQTFQEPNILYGDWMWNSSTDASGKTVSPEDPSQFILTFSSNGKLKSSTDCNSVSGSFIKNEEALSIGALASTEMACSGKNLDLAYISQLSQVSSYSISGNTLTLKLIKDFGVMKFSRK